MRASTSSFDTIVAYHEATKHHLHRYARSAGHMDWPNQPNPFRHYEGTERTMLSVRHPHPGVPYCDLYTPIPDQGAELNLTSVGTFCELSLGLSAWKQSGASRWALRCNPSSGNLHPSEGYFILPPMNGLGSGVFHYAPYDHALERRAHLSEAVWAALQSHLGAPGFGVALTSISWRESWKYGERAFRYCLLDAGHALAALAFAARLHHWHCWLVAGISDQHIGMMLGLDHTSWWPQEKEMPDMFCWVATGPGHSPVRPDLVEEVARPLDTLRFEGRPNRLSPQSVDWSIIGQAAVATEKPTTPSQPVVLLKKPLRFQQPEGPTAAEVIQQRRSAVAFDSTGFIAADTLRAILDPALARENIPPFGMALMSPAVHLLVFVHRVTDVAPGLYLLARGQEDADALKPLWRNDFVWQPAMADWPFYLLWQGDVTNEAMTMSCHQEIAGNSAFAVSMLAPFEDALRKAPHLYRHLHWECGMIGQVLYLGAEAHGVRGTGIGCFFDDEVHRFLGIQDRRFQCLYHFTIGHPIEDHRLTTLPAYHHLDR